MATGPTLIVTQRNLFSAQPSIVTPANAGIQVDTFS
jgi:hypothetical protein